MFAISSTPLEDIHLKEGLISDRAGALSIFEGLVRNHNEGKEVHALEYEAATSLCEKEAQKVLTEVTEKFDILHTKCIHRVGKLAIGEMAVWVGVTAAHRDEAFLACRYIIDEIKIRLPIWKKEYYVDGNAEWVNCQACANHKHEKHQDSPSV